MKYINAKKLHNGDEVIIKETGRVLTVIQAYEDIADENTVFVDCDDGNTYHHRDIK